MGLQPIRSDCIDFNKKVLCRETARVVLPVTQPVQVPSRSQIGGGRGLPHPVPGALPPSGTGWGIPGEGTWRQSKYYGMEMGTSPL